jgi:hypothetical protein
LFEGAQLNKKKFAPPFPLKTEEGKGREREGERGRERREWERRETGDLKERCCDCV